MKLGAREMFCRIVTQLQNRQFPCSICCLGPRFAKQIYTSQLYEISSSGHGLPCTVILNMIRLKLQWHEWVDEEILEPSSLTVAQLPAVAGGHACDMRVTASKLPLPICSNGKGLTRAQ